MPSVIVDYNNDSKKLWRIWDPAFQQVKAQSEVNFDDNGDEHMSCQYENIKIYIDMFRLSGDNEYIVELDARDEPLRGHDSHPTQLGRKSTSHITDATNDEAANTHRSRCSWTNQPPQHSAANTDIAHSWHLHWEDQTPHSSATRINISSEVPTVARAPPLVSRVTRCQGKASTKVQLPCTAVPFTYVGEMDSPQWDLSTWAMEVETTSTLINNIFSINSREASLLQVNLIHSTWV